MKSVIVVGGGFGGLSTACYLAKAGYSVKVIEKNSWIGGRAQTWESNGFRFDMGPSFYWMPEVFETFFNDMGKKRADYYSITRLNPGYNCVFSPTQIVDIPADKNEIYQTFESLESGSSEQLRKFLDAAQKKYEISLNHFIYKQFSNIFNFVSRPLIQNISKLELFPSYTKLVRKHFKSPQIRAILEYPTVFLGAPGPKLPGTYTLMNHVDLNLGTWYPDEGFSGVAQSIFRLAKELGVTFHTDTKVTSLITSENKVSKVETNKGEFAADIVVSAAPYHHIESLLPKKLRQYNDEYWGTRTLSPSCLNFYLGINRKLPKLQHHTFFFDKDWETHFQDTYGKRPKWQKDPLFYAHVASKTDTQVAPAGSDTLYILIPVASGLDDKPEIVNRLKSTVIERINEVVGFDLREYIVTEKAYSHSNFVNDYNSLKGSAFGLGQTLFQTASFRPKNKSKKVKNLYFAGQDTIPGTSTVMSIISGKVTSKLILNNHKHD